MIKQLRRRRRPATVCFAKPIETLENRQLLSAVVDVRVTGGGQSVTVDHVGQVVNFDVFVTVTGSDADGSNDGFQTLAASMLSPNVSGGSALGNLAVSPVAPFTASGSTSGTPVDLDGDTDLDIGNNDTGGSAAGQLGVRSSSMTFDGGTVNGASHTFKIATGTFTVTSLLTGVSTSISLRPPSATQAAFNFLYAEDSNGTTGFKNGTDGGSITAGATITLKRPGAASINGRVFNDKNANGIFDGDDVGIGGFRAFLDENFNGVLDTGEVSTPVSSTGTYHFTNVVAGTYRVREVFRTGWRQSFPALGYYEVTLGYGQTAKSQSFANTDTIVIKGKVWMDANKNKTIDAAETGLPGWYVYLDHNNNGVFDKGDDWSLSDANGNYRFFNLPAGTYLVRIQQQAKYTQTAPGGGFYTLNLAAGQTTSNKNFGEKRLK